MKITFLGLNKEEIDFFKETFLGQDMDFFTENLGKIKIEEIIDSQILCLNAFSKLDAITLSKFNDLNLIATRSTGYDHIDLNYCNEHGIAVKNVPLYGDVTIAEYTFAMLLTLSRKVLEGKQKILDGRFDKEDLQGFDLEGKTIGIIGGGNIGINVANMALGFGMNVLVYDMAEDKKLAKKVGFSYTSMEKLLQESDVVSLHVPYNEKTYHMIDDNSFNQMKQGVILLNTARGEIIDTKELIHALESKKIGAVGLDVFEGEGVFQTTKDPNDEHMDNIKRVLQFDNVLITPHNAFNTKEAVQRINETTVINIQEFIL